MSSTKNKVIAYFSDFKIILLHLLQRVLSMKIWERNSTLQGGRNIMKLL